MQKLTVSYARVSSLTQSTQRQIDGFASCTAILGDSGRLKQTFDRQYEDKCSGSIKFGERQGGKRLLDDCRKGMIREIHFWEISRLGRDALDIAHTINEFVELGIQVIIKKEGIQLLDEQGKVNATAQIIIAVLSVLSQIERVNILERQAEGIAAARARGAFIGRKAGTEESNEKFLGKSKSQKIMRFLREEKKITHVALLAGCSTATVYKVKRAQEQEAKYRTEHA